VIYRHSKALPSPQLRELSAEEEEFRDSCVLENDPPNVPLEARPDATAVEEELQKLRHIRPKAYSD
jgi:hypothetical protein